MKKLSNITESVWADIHKRSNGTVVRKEDDIDLLDRDGLYDYLTSHYKNTNAFAPIYNSETFDTIKVPFLIQGGSDGVLLNFKKNEVSIPYSSPYKVKGLFSKLRNEFSLKSDAPTECTWYIISPKDGSKVTNTFFIYVIDFLIDNIPDSFEKGVEKIVTESVWADIHKRSNGSQERKEDEFGNIKFLKPIDIGLSVIWADRDLIIDGNDYFEFNEIKELTKPIKGWRLPTLEEVAELDTIKNSYASNDNEFYFEIAGQHLGFPKAGFIRQIYSTTGWRSFPVDENRFYYGWTSTSYDGGSTHILTFDEERIWHTPVNSKRTTEQVIQPNQDKLCVRLVKDK